MVIDMKNRIIIVVLVLFHVYGIGELFAQHRPDWTNGYYEKIGSCIYEKVEATGFTYEEAYKDARQKALDNCAGRYGIAGHYSSEEKGGTFVIIQNGEKIAKINVIGSFPNAEDFRQGGTVYLLVQEMDDCRMDFPDVKYTTEYPASARVLIPGMEQFYKGQQAKGVFFLASETVAVGSIIVAQTLKANNENLRDNTHTSMRRTYDEKARMWNGISVGSCIVAGILYGFNICDGLFSDGEGRIFLSDASFAISPFVSQQSSGFALCFKF